MAYSIFIPIRTLVFNMSGTPAVWDQTKQSSTWAGRQPPRLHQVIRKWVITLKAMLLNAFAYVCVHLCFYILTSLPKMPSKWVNDREACFPGYANRQRASCVVGRHVGIEHGTQPLPLLTAPRTPKWNVVMVWRIVCCLICDLAFVCVHLTTAA